MASQPTLHQINDNIFQIKEVESDYIYIKPHCGCAGKRTGKDGNLEWFAEPNPKTFMAEITTWEEHEGLPPSDKIPFQEHPKIKPYHHPQHTPEKTRFIAEINRLHAARFFISTNQMFEECIKNTAHEATCQKLIQKIKSLALTKEQPPRTALHSLEIAIQTHYDLLHTWIPAYGNLLNRTQNPAGEARAFHATIRLLVSCMEKTIEELENQSWDKPIVIFTQNPQMREFLMNHSLATWEHLPPNERSFIINHFSKL
jgi:hypothetical protein